MKGIIKFAYLLVVTFTYLHPASPSAAKKQRDRIIQEALHNGTIPPCEAAKQMKEKYGPSFELAAALCTDQHELEHIATTPTCGVSCLRTLQKENVNLDTPDESGKTPLHYAVNQADTDKVEYLVACKAQALRKDKQGNTPVDYAAQRLDDNTLIQTDKIEKNIIPIQMLIALQNGTTTPILNPMKYPFFKKYALQSLTVDPVCLSGHYNDRDNYGDYIHRFDQRKECVIYLTYARWYAMLMSAQTKAIQNKSENTGDESVDSSLKRLSHLLTN